MGTRSTAGLRSLYSRAALDWRRLSKRNGGRPESALGALNPRGLSYARNARA